MTLSVRDHQRGDCSSVTHSKILWARPAATNTSGLLLLPCSGGKAAVTQSCARYLQLQAHERSVKYKGNLEQLQDVPYLQLLAGDSGREWKLCSWHICPDSGTQRASSSGDWTPFAVPISCYEKVCYNGGVFHRHVTSRYRHRKI